MTRPDADPIASLAAFCRAHPTPGFPAADAEWFLSRMISGREKFLALSDASGLGFVGAVMDTCANAGDAAELVVLGLRAGAEALAREALAPALRLAAEGPRTRLDVPAPSGGAYDAATLAAHGFAEAYRTFTMRRPAGPIPAPVPLAEPFRWAVLDEALVGSYAATVARAFADVPGSFVPPLEELRPRALAHRPPIRLVMDGDRVAGFLRVQVDGEEGELQSLGRHPDHRGARLGPPIVSTGLRLLADAGCTTFRLEVAAANERALGLYRSFGFDVVASVGVWRRELRANV